MEMPINKLQEPINVPDCTVRYIFVDRNTAALSIDQPGPGGARHKYVIDRMVADGNNRLLEIKFQEGGIQDNGVNGVQNEHLLAIVIDRLRGFQSGPFACQENQEALEACEGALLALQERTIDRMARGVEGRSER